MTPRERARRAITAAQNGQVGEAHRLLAELASDGYPEASAALSEAERGRWTMAIDVLRRVAGRKAEK